MPENNLGLGVVGGCGSSGTTLLAHLLSKHPDIASGPEFNLFNHYELYDLSTLKRDHVRILDGKCKPSGYIDVGAFMTYREHFGLDAAMISEWIRQAGDTRGFVAAVCGHMHDCFSRPYFLEKSPTNVYCFPQLVQQFPEVPLVHVVRDGRDVVCSLMKRGFNLYGAASRWLYDTMCGLSVRDAPNYLEIRYETLVSEPDKTLAVIFTHLGVGNAEQGTERNANEAGVYNENWMDRDVPRVWNQTPSDPVSTASIGKYRTSLSPRQLNTLLGLTIKPWAAVDSMPQPRSFGDLLAYLGYSGETDSTGAGVLSYPERLQLQWGDFHRRWLRFSSLYGLAIPKFYTTFK